MRTRLNKTIREEILANVLAATDLEDRRTELRQLIQAAVKKLIIQDQPAEFVALTKIHPKEWFASCNQVYYGCEDELYPLAVSFDPPGTWQSRSLHLDDPVCVTNHYSWNAADHKAALLPLTKEAAALIEERKALVSEIRAFLQSCPTAEAVAERMPELTRHIPKIARPMPLVAPSNLLSSLTKIGFDRTAAT
jgi:hypothetical protein